MQTFLHSTTPSWNARSVINKKLKTGSLEATFLRRSSFKMPGLTRDNEIAHQSQSLLDNQNGGQNQNNQNPEVYIIPEYSLSRSHPGHLLVLPFVPHPSATTSSSNFQAPAPPPHYFCTAQRTTTPSYHDPPPDYETIGHINHGATFETTGLSQSCSCSTQLTSVADDYGARSLHGIYDNGSGLSGLDRNEALTASYLYPELLNVTSTRTRTSFSSNHQRRLRPQSSISSTSSTTISTIQQQRRSSSIFSNQRQYLTVKKWVIVVLVLMLLMTISLLVGITLQHFQLLRKFLHTQKKTSEQEMMMQSTTTERFSSADIIENFIPK